MAFMILKFCGSFFVIFVFYDFFRDQLQRRVKDRKRIALILFMCAAATRAVNSLDSSLANMIFGLLILMVQMLLLFQDDGRKELFLLLIGETVALFLEIMADLFFVRSTQWTELMGAFGLDQAEGDFVMGLMAYLVCWLALRSLKFYFLRTNCAIGEHFPLSFFILPLTTALIYLGAFFQKVGGQLAMSCLILGYILLPLANILMFYTIHKLFFISEKNREQQLTEQQTALQQRYYQHLEEIDLGHRRYAHDLKNCMTSIGALAAAGRNREIIALLRDMEVELDTLTGRRYTANPILNALLWEKESLAQRCGVHMDIDVEAAEWACIPGRDLIVMAGNLLDNAIEAAERCPAGHVRVALYAREHFLTVEVENTCAEPPSPGRKSLLSTKPDAANHGFGLSNVRDAAKKYGGTLYTQQKDDRFTAILTIAKICLASD